MGILQALRGLFIRIPADAVEIHKQNIFSRRIGARLKFLRQHGEDYRKLDNLLPNLDEIWGEAVKAKNWEIIYQLGACASDFLTVRGRWGQCRRWLESGREAAHELGYLYEEAQFLNQLSVCLLNLGDTRQAQDYARQSEELLERLTRQTAALTTERELAQQLHQRGHLHHAQGDYRQARRSYERSLRLAESHRRPLLIADNLHELGTIAYETGHPREALRFFQRSLEIRERISDLNGIADVYHEMGRVYASEKQYDEAEKYYDQSLRLSQRVGNRRTESSTLHQKGNLRVMQERYYEARPLYDRSLSIKNEIGFIQGIGPTLNQLGLLEYYAEHYEQAKQWYEQALDFARRADDRITQARILSNLKTLYMRTGDYDTAQSYHDQIHRLGL